MDEKFKQAVAAKQDWSFECRIIRTDGQVRWIWAAGRHAADENGCLKRLVGIVQDITERKQVAEAEALREQELFYRSILSSINDAVFLTDHQGVLTYVCPNAQVIFGRSEQELLEMRKIAHVLGA